MSGIHSFSPPSQHYNRKQHKGISTIYPAYMEIQDEIFACQRTCMPDLMIDVPLNHSVVIMLVTTVNTLGSIPSKKTE